MSDVTLRNANGSWEAAENAAFNYLCKVTGYVNGRNAFIGDQIPDDKGNIFVFISGGEYGGGEAVEFYQVPKPAFHYKMMAALLGQFEHRKDALAFAGKILDQMPAYDNKNSSTAEPTMTDRGLAPNVECFEVTEHPSTESRVVDINDTKRQTWWMLRMDFRIAYYNSELIDIET